MRRSAFRAAGVRMVCATLLSPCARTAHEAIKRRHPHHIHLHRDVAGVGTGHAPSSMDCLVPVSGCGREAPRERR